MKLNSNNSFMGWKSSLILLATYIAAEFGLPKLGSDWSAFLYVTFHFVMLPILSVLVIIATTVKVFKTEKASQKAILLSSLIVPIFIVSVALTGTTYFARMFGVDFNK